MDSPKTVDYTIRKSERARSVRLRIVPEKGLELVIPRQFDPGKVPEIVKKHQAWIEKHLARCLPKKGRVELPDRIALNAIHEVWQVQYLACTRLKKIRIVQWPGNVLRLMGNVSDEAACQSVLIKWTKDRAHAFLSASLMACSAQTGLFYRDFTLRGQKTRWGSCTAAKSISLNYKLIFLPETLARHIVLHELAHTRHLNHSLAFWKLVASLDPGWKEHRQQLRDAAQKEWVPDWVSGTLCCQVRPVCSRHTVAPSK